MQPQIRIHGKLQSIQSAARVTIQSRERQPLINEVCRESQRSRCTTSFFNILSGSALTTTTCMPQRFLPRHVERPFVANSFEMAYDLHLLRLAYVPTGFFPIRSRTVSRQLLKRENTCHHRHHKGRCGTAGFGIAIRHLPCPDVRRKMQTDPDRYSPRCGRPQPTVTAPVQYSRLPPPRGGFGHVLTLPCVAKRVLPFPSGF